jgi:glyoxylase-like metal-dependent hydrolase (beta-lactamase superfamily II)
MAELWLPRKDEVEKVVGKGETMKTEIHRLSLGCNCYLIKEEGIILVDGGSPNKEKKFRKQLKDLSIEPKDISLILLTHGHWDHIGSIHELKRLTGCEVAINQHEKDWVEQALKPIPPGINLWGKILGVIAKISMLLVNFPATSVDLVLEDKEFPLESYGIHGKVLYTPGHSLGSMSLLLATGDAFVGDLAVNGLPQRIGPGMSVFAEDISAVKESWRLLLNRGARWIYPAHGNPFKADLLEKLL